MNSPQLHYNKELEVMNANSHQEFEFADAAREGGLAEDASTTLQREAYDGKLPLPSRPSSTVALGNLELIQTGPVATDSRVQQLHGQHAEASTTRPSDQQSNPIDRPQVTFSKTAVERGGTPVETFFPMSFENHNVLPLEGSRIGVQEMINREKAEKFFEAIKVNDTYAIGEALRDLQAHPESIDFVRDYLQKQLGLKRDEVQIVFNRKERGITTLQLELCKTDWPGPGERRLPSGTRVIIDSEGSANGYDYNGWHWTTMNAKAALTQFYAPAKRERPVAPASATSLIQALGDYPNNIRPGDSKH